MQNNPVTIVTAFFDINREEKGDGRKLEDYKQWIKHTLQLNCNLFIVTEEKFKDFFMEHRNPNYHTFIHIMKFTDLHYYQYYDRIKEILESDAYKNKIAYPNRVECVLPEYNIIQYSKTHFLKLACEQNPFQSDYFFWLDAGASRFFTNMNIDKPFPSEIGIQKIKTAENHFMAQHRPDLNHYPFDKDFIWKADNLIYGGMFGGNKEVIQFMFFHLEEVFVRVMLNACNVNNEQLALAIIYKTFPDVFSMCNTGINEPILLLKILSL